MAACNLIIDSCCDLPPEVVKQEGVYLLRFPYVMEGGVFKDDLFETVTPKAFYDAMRNGSEPSTSQVSVPDFTDIFEQTRENGLPTVYLSFTSGLSGSYDTACLVRDQMKEEHPDMELYVVDTHLASIAEGLLVLEALNLHAKGLTAAELAEWAERARYFVNESFMVDDLKSLVRGGRIPSAVGVVGSALDAKPLLNIGEDGTLGMAGVARGRKKGLRQLTDAFAKRAEDPQSAQTVLIGHADCPKDADKLMDMLRKVNPSIPFVVCNIGPVIGSHVGPGMIAVSFWGRDKRETLSVADRIARTVKGGN